MLMFEIPHPHRMKGVVRGLAPLALILCLAGCGGSRSTVSDDNVEEVAEDAEAPEVNDEGESGAEKAGETYEEYDDRRDSYAGSRGTFDGVGCTVDCGGHEAGYAWAEEHGIDDPDQCGGNSWSFIEGCQSYAEEQSGRDDNYDNNEGSEEEY